MPVENKTELLTDQKPNLNNDRYDNSYMEGQCSEFEANDRTIPIDEFIKTQVEKDKSIRISNKIKELLSDNFGNAKTSKAITYERKTTKKYYYNLKNREDILKFVDILNNNLSESMFDTFYKKDELYSTKVGEKDKLQLCACYYEKMTHGMIIDYPVFVVEFYLIIGISYHKIKKNRIGASIILSKNPVISMSYNEQETFFGLFSKLQVINEEKQQKFRGINYFVNKYLYINNEFRNFISQLFTYYGTEFNEPILKDVGRTIMKNGCFLPEITYKELLLCHTPKDIIKKHITIVDGIKLNFNKYDLNVSWVIMKMLPYIDKRDYNILLNFYKIGITKFLCLSMFFEGFNEVNTILMFFKYYYRRYVWIEADPIEFYGERYLLYRDFDDYFYQSVNMNQKVRLNLSFRKFLQLNNKISESYRNRCKVNHIKIVKDNSKFNNLENELLAFSNITRIKTDTDLYEEGENQNNCVFSRLSEICSDKIAIFHWDCNDESITIQFSKLQNGYYIDEMRAKYNKNCTIEAKELIKRRLKDINSMQNLLNGFENIE